MTESLAAWLVAEVAKLPEGAVPETAREAEVFAFARRLALEQVLLRLTAPVTPTDAPPEGGQ